MRPSGRGAALFDCPSYEALVEFDRGELSDQGYDAVSVHISSCERCADVLRNMHDQTTGDSLVADLKDCYRGHPVPDGRSRDGATDLALTVTMPAGHSHDTVAPISRPDTDEVVGKTIGQYRVDQRIGWGGMGVVYRARQIPLNRDVALKMISAGYHASPQAVARFKREVEAVARLNSPNVVQVYELGEHEGLPFFSMELAEGGSLQNALLANGPLGPVDAAVLVRTLALAVKAAHQANVIHRDLKPGNVLFAADGTPKVADFGLAKLVDSDSGGNAFMTSAADTILGTAQYMSPEQAAGRSAEIGTATDVYALGAILYATLTGHPPFEADSRIKILELVRSTVPRPPSRLCPAVPFWLESICLKCLEKVPASRYSSAQSLADDLDRWLRGARPDEATGRLNRFGRSLRRHSVAILIGLAVVAAGAAAFMASPTRALERIRLELASGRTVDLIGKTGGPRYSRNLVGRSKTEVIHNADGAFTVYTVTLSLLELVPDPQCDRFRFRAQIRHDDSDVWGEVGLFFAHKAYSLPRRAVHFFTRLSFNAVRWQDQEERRQMPESVKLQLNLPPTPRRNTVDLSAELYSDDGNAPGPDLKVGLITGLPFDALGKLNGVWHDVEVEVTPERVTGRWDGQPFSIATETVRNHAADYLRYNPPPAGGPPPSEIRPAFSPRGALGLYVRNGVAAFRSVRVTPL